MWVNVHGHAAGNPRLFNGPDGALWLLAPINYGRWCQGGTRLYLKRSYDSGWTWTDLELFIESKGILGKNKPLYLPPATWLIPAEFEHAWQAVFIRLVDQGAHWRLVEPPPTRARLHQPSLVTLSSGTLLAYLRSWEGTIYQTRSSDQGASWTKPEPTTLPNNNSGLDLVRLRSGMLLLACNPVGLGEHGDQVAQFVGVEPALIPRRRSAAEQRQLENYTELGGEEGNAGYPKWGPRTPLSLVLSPDEGATWQHFFDLESGPGEFSYPAILQVSDGGVHIVYTWNRRRIQHVNLAESDFLVPPEVKQSTHKVIKSLTLPKPSYSG